MIRTVKNLIEELSKMPAQAQVWIEVDEECDNSDKNGYPIKSVAASNDGFGYTCCHLVPGYPLAPVE